MLNDEQIVDSGSTGNNVHTVVDRLSSETATPSHDISYNLLSLPQFYGNVPTQQSETSLKV